MGPTGVHGDPFGGLTPGVGVSWIGLVVEQSAHLCVFGTSKTIQTEKLSSSLYPLGCNLLGVCMCTRCTSRRGGMLAGVVVVFEEVVWWSNLRSNSDLMQHSRPGQTCVAHVQIHPPACTSGERWADTLLTSAGVSDFSPARRTHSSLQTCTHLIHA